MPASVGRPAAIDRESLAIDETALGGVCKEANRACNVIRARKASHGNTPRDVLVAVTSACLVGDVHLSLHPAWTDGVDANATSAPLSGKGAGEPDEPVFRGVIGGPVTDTDETGDGSDVDDAALSLLEHEGTEDPRQNEGCDQVHLEHSAKRRRFNRLGGSDEADTRIVDENIGTAPALLHEGHSLSNECFVGDVADERFCLGTSRMRPGERRVTRLLIQQQKCVPSFSENLRNPAPDPLRRTRDDGYSHTFTLAQLGPMRSERHASNNERWIIPHNLEAKALGIKMGDPEFKIRDLIKRENVKVFSSNYALYGSLSEKVTATLLSMVPTIEPIRLMKAS